MSNKNKADILGMPHGTATAKLRKQLLFKYVGFANCLTCYKCNEEITNIDDFSIEHILPWESTKDADKFWDLDNIAFSHMKCNKPHVYGGRKKVGPAGTKWCWSCQDFINILEFGVNKNEKDGLQRRCKKCNVKYR